MPIVSDYHTRGQEEFNSYYWASLKATISGKAKARSERCLRCMDCIFKHLHLGQYSYMKERLSILGRTTSGFGAWKPSPLMLEANGISTSPVYRAKKFARSVPHDKHLLPLEILNATALYLRKLPPPAKTTMWKNFGGPYVAMQLPAVHPPGCPHRFKVEMEILNEPLEVTAELDNLPFACIKYLPKVLKPGFPNRCESSYYTTITMQLMNLSALKLLSKCRRLDRIWDSCVCAKNNAYLQRFLFFFKLVGALNDTGVSLPVESRCSLS